MENKSSWLKVAWSLLLWFLAFYVFPGSVVGFLSTFVVFLVSFLVTIPTSVYTLVFSVLAVATMVVLEVWMYTPGSKMASITKLIRGDRHFSGESYWDRITG